MFFLLIAVSQFFPFLKVGLLITYVAPLVFVLIVTMIKEAYDDIQRYRRDKELNLKKYERISNKGILKNIHAKDIKVGDILKIKTNERIPADMLLLMTAEKKHGSGGGTTVFVRTDQLDGETDWKLRKALPFTQNACSLQDLT